MAIGNAGLAARIEKEASITRQFKTFLGRYFSSLFQAKLPRPLLWIHGAAFSTRAVFFIAQSALLCARKVSVHRLLGWFGAGLAAAMVVLGLTIAVLMIRFDTFVLQQKGVDAFLSIPFADMLIFGPCITMAIYWRKTRNTMGGLCS